MPSDLLIRPARPQDAAAVAPLVEELGYRTDPREVRARLERIIHGADTGALVAELDGRVVGLATHSLTHLIYRPSPQCRLTALVVGAGQRRRGVGRALVAEVESVARRSGCDRLELTTRPSRSDALGLYAALGFERRPERLIKWLASG